MILKFDRQIQISVGNSRKDLNWKRQTLSIGDLWERLKTPQRGQETFSEYMAMKKAQQDDLKDVGGFVAGTLHGPRRKVAAMTGRDVVTLDFDNIPPQKTDMVLSIIAMLGKTASVYSTRKHNPEAPRLRILFPLNRTVSVDEYEPIARRMAEWINISWADPTTFEASRLMYWPSCCRDGEYIFKYWDAPLCDADEILRSYTDWKDRTSWPQVPGAAVNYQKLATKQGDPDTKPGLVGAFNRAYGDVYAVMDKLLPGVYDPVDNDLNRFTYAGGSTTGGAVVYNHGKFLYSHHATDPCGGRLVNCFDLVRLHKFGAMDETAAEGTPFNRLPSYLEMEKYAATIPEVIEEQAKARREAAIKDFSEAIQKNEKPPDSYFHKLSAKGTPTEILDARIEDYIIKTNRLIVLEGQAYFYDSGFYHLDTDGRHIKNLIRRCIVPELVTAYRIDRVYKLFLNDENLAVLEDQVNNYPGHWINFQNGMLDVKTNQFFKHSPDYLSLNQIPYAYDATSVYPGCTADLFLQGLIPDQDDRNMLLAYVGLCLTRDTSFQKFLVLLGRPGIGKSALCSFVTKVIGSQNISSVPLQRLNERFQSVPLMNKLINISTDIPASSMDQTSVIRLITGEDKVPAEIKGGKSFHFNNYARLLFSANEMPAVLSENPEAYFRRLLVIECTKGTHIENLHAGLESCIPAFISECVRRLQVCYKLNTRMDSPKSEGLVNDLLSESDSTYGFIKECIIPDPDGRVPQRDLYEKYCSFCYDRQWRPKSNQRFYNSIRRNYPSRKSNGKDWFYGIRFSEEIR